ncbi:response regulator transcription factor [Microbispora sp. NEAU-D428]|uniref:response regulator n=1 Tax=Microbispora sitophila TaxID=2771537 RepID=UPI0018675197|nr:response regulator transcription factor [Microbispora sitophila]MBE3012974.1 response regulator transcription factor [Microbispora sitophila]
MIRVVIADDQALVRGGFRAILENDGDIEVVAEANDGLEAVEACRRLRPEVVLMDVRMPHLDGLAATRRLLADDSTPLRVLMLTTFDLDEYVYAALRAGASGFLLKDTPADRLAPAVRTVAAGQALLAPSVTRRLIERFAQQPAATRVPGERLARLTERETDVLRAMARALSNAEIARELHLSEATVKTHITHLLAKLGLRDRVQAVVLAYEEGLVRPGASDIPFTTR